MFNVIVIGDCCFDTFIQIQQAKLLGSIEENKMLCLNYGSKIPINKINVSMGGNAANVAASLNKLGLKIGIYTVLGDDENGEQIYQKIKKRKIETKFIKKEKNSKTNCSFVIKFKNDRTILVYHHSRKYFLPKLDKTEWIYLTSVGKNHQELHQQIIDLVEKKKIKLIFNPGTYQLKTGFKKLKKIFEATTILNINKEEAQFLVKEMINKNIKENKKLLEILKNYGPEIVVMTQGRKGACVYDGKEYFKMPALPGHRVDVTGAGDSFASAFLAGFIYQKNIKQALKWGIINSSFTIRKIGAQEGLLKKQEIIKQL
ncbi:MAG: carbohydrate kinase family protein [Patescibacteria group bacterium]